MTHIRFHDTMVREKRAFVPADPARVTMYVCGPTVYNRAHIGNARPAVIFDVLARLLRHTYGEDALVYARNVTDVDDKIIDAAKAEGVDPSVVTRRYEDFYLADMGALGVRPPNIAPRATENVAEMIGMIARLIEGGHAYEADGHILFHVPSDPDYGALGRRDRDAMIAGARVEIASYKKDPADFVLWKPSEPQVIGWDSPWGRGRPGWHIECSAMIERHLGETIDIHGGGLDLIFPHHENEIAQSRCANRGAPLARYWMHNGFLSMAGSEKMSKSLGNVVDPLELADAFGIDQLRYFLLREVTFGQDGSYSAEAIVNRVNADLANSFGNLAQRTLSFIAKNCEGVMPAGGKGDAADDVLLAQVSDAAAEMRAAFNDLALSQGIEAWLKAVFACNQYIDVQAPWTLRKTDPDRMTAVLGTLYAAIRDLAIIIAPVIPASTAKLLDQMGIPAGERTHDVIGNRSGIETLAASSFRLAAPTPIFPRLELPADDT